MIEPIAVKKANQVFQVNRRKASTRCVYIIFLTIIVVLILATITFVSVYFTVFVNKTDDASINHNKKNSSSSLIENEQSIIRLNDSFYENNCEFYYFIIIKK